MSVRRAAIVALLTACHGPRGGGDDTAAPDGTDDTPPDPPEDTTDDPPGDTAGAPRGFIGAPCAGPADCDYPDAVCLTDGYPRGMCSLPCDELCPDRPGQPVTFCVGDPPWPAGLGDGACYARCDLGLFPGTGCREGYACERHARPTGVEQYVCVPGSAGALTRCQQRLADRGVAFAPVVIPDQYPSDLPGQVCHVEDPVELHPPIAGVAFSAYDGTPTPRLRMSCDGAQALVDTAEDVAAEGVVEVLQLGTINCRAIAGTTTLSRHGYGDAIDLYGFRFDDGSLWTLVDDWEHDTTSFSTPAAAWLYGTAHRWHDDRLWNVILTPNYNAAHDNHFHVDLTPGSDFLGRLRWPYLGMNPTDD
ncbi:MAG TPA: extensin family protein [Myxococcota bacterium]|nr:extensin family protein [Myxococcota bacterium]